MAEILQDEERQLKKKLNKKENKILQLNINKPFDAIHQGIKVKCTFQKK